MTFSDFAEFRRAFFLMLQTSPGTTFSDLTEFSEATFASNTWFINADRKSRTRFEAATFRSSPPRFFGAKLHEGTVWRRTKWSIPMNTGEAGEFVDAYERLKLEMDRLKKYEDELDFFALELQSRRVLHGDWQPISQVKLLGRSTIALYRPAFGIAIALYGFLCDYGRSYVRPLIGLFFIVVIGAALCVSHFGIAKYPQAIGLSLANTFGVFGFRKDFIDPHVVERLSRTLKIIAALQTIFGTGLLFLFGLAVRNRFRMK